MDNLWFYFKKVDYLKAYYKVYRLYVDDITSPSFQTGQAIPVLFLDVSQYTIDY